MKHLVGILEDNASPIGNIHDKDPWGFIELAGLIDHPKTREMIVRALPMLLRAQKPDGGWGDASYVVFRALHRHDLIAPLGKLPPLPPDWRIVRSILAPRAELRTLCWDGEKIWTVRPDEDVTLYAISPEDGKVLKTLPVNAENVRGVGWCDGKLLLAQRKPNSVMEADPHTGEILRVVRIKGDIVFELSGVAPVADKIWACDDFCPCIWEYDPSQVEFSGEEGHPTAICSNPRYIGLAGPGPFDIAVHGKSVWHCDWMTPLLIRSGLDGRLLDWGERPFPEVAGITYDGENLWVLDGKEKRLCIVLRKDSVSGQEDILLLQAEASARNGTLHLLDAGRCEVDGCIRATGAASLLLSLYRDRSDR